MGSVVSFINHSNESNAQLVWSNHEGHQETWLYTNPKELLLEDHMYLGLVTGIDALRDMQRGEEIFIDAKILKKQKSLFPTIFQLKKKKERLKECGKRN